LALAALISAYRHIDESEALRATLPLVGGTLIELQARQAVQAGASHVVILVERLPATLTAAIDALRRDGIRIEIARSVTDAADRVHPDERLLVIADGCVFTQAATDRMARAEAPTLLTLSDEPSRDAFERIDAGTRWAGMMLIDGARLRSTIGMLGDWDLESTLLRRTVQENAARLSVFATEEGRTPAGLPLMAEDAAALADLEKHLVAASRRRASSWPARFIFAPLEEPAAHFLLKRVREPEWIGALAALLALFALAFEMADWRWPALAALLLSGPAAAVAERLAAVRISSIRRQALFDRVRAVAASGCLIALGSSLAAQGGWGWWLLSASVIAIMLALSVEQRIAARAGATIDSIWLASLDGMIWAMLPFALVGEWGIGLAALGLYAGLSFAWVQRAHLRDLGGGQGVQV
jgi:hypothetical protein